MSAISPPRCETGSNTPSIGIFGFRCTNPGHNKLKQPLVLPSCN